MGEEEMQQRGRIGTTGDLSITHRCCAVEWFANEQSGKGAAARLGLYGMHELNEKYESPMETDLPGASTGIDGRLNSQSIVLGD